MSQGSAAEVMPAILFSQCAKHFGSAIRAKFLTDEIHIGGRKSAKEHELKAAANTIRGAAGWLKSGHAFAELRAKLVEVAALHEQRVFRVGPKSCVNIDRDRALHGAQRGAQKFSIPRDAGLLPLAAEEQSARIVVLAA